MTRHESMTLRVAISRFYNEITGPEYAALLGPIAAMYKAQCRTILEKILP